MKVAALDLGTNTFLCLICEVESGVVTRVYSDEVEVVRLGQDVRATGRFHSGALARAERAFQKFSETIQKHKPQRVLAMATSASRDVSNAEELFALGVKYNIPIQIIPGAEEAKITYAGALAGVSDQKQRLVIDIGGGSTEIIVGKGPEMLVGESLNLGCVRLTEKYQLQTPVDLESLQYVTLEIRKEMDPTLRRLSLGLGEVEEVVAVAGTPTEIARAQIGGQFDATKIEGLQLSESDLIGWRERFRTHSKEEIVSLYGIHEKRADVILVGVLLLLECLRGAGRQRLTVSTRGVRYGVALEVAK